MKKFLIIPAAALILASCGGSGACDTSTADGAAKCLCELSKDADKAEKDEAKMKEIQDKFVEIEKNIKDGKYSENDVEEAAAKIDGCDL